MVYPHTPSHACAELLWNSSMRYSLLWWDVREARRRWQLFSLLCWGDRWIQFLEYTYIFAFLIQSMKLDHESKCCGWTWISTHDKLGPFAVASQLTSKDPWVWFAIGRESFKLWDQAAGRFERDKVSGPTSSWSSGKELNQFEWKDVGSFGEMA